MTSQPIWYAYIDVTFERYRLAADRVSALDELRFSTSDDCPGYDENGSDRDYDYYVNFPDGRTELHNTRTDNDRDYTENALTDYITNEDHPEDSSHYG